MARTNKTARKSASCKAPRKQLATNVSAEERCAHQTVELPSSRHELQQAANIALPESDPDEADASHELAAATQLEPIQDLDDTADTTRMIALYTVHDPTKLPKIGAILAKRPTHADRDNMWSQLGQKYPVFFTRESPVRTASEATSAPRAAVTPAVSAMSRAGLGVMPVDTAMCGGGLFDTPPASLATSGGGTWPSAAMEDPLAVAFAGDVPSAAPPASSATPLSSSAAAPVATTAPEPAAAEEAEETDGGIFGMFSDVSGRLGRAIGEVVPDMGSLVGELSDEAERQQQAKQGALAPLVAAYPAHHAGWVTRRLECWHERSAELKEERRVQVGIGTPASLPSRTFRKVKRAKPGVRPGTDLQVEPIRAVGDQAAGAAGATNSIESPAAANFIVLLQNCLCHTEVPYSLSVLTQSGKCTASRTCCSHCERCADFPFAVPTRAAALSETTLPTAPSLKAPSLDVKAPSLKAPSLDVKAPSLQIVVLKKTGQDGPRLDIERESEYVIGR